jgi:hypothetical protein
MWFFAAAAAEFLAAVAEQAGAARSPEEERPRGGFGAFAAAVATLLTPGLLLLHGFLLTLGGDQGVRVWLMAAPMAAMIGGALVGAILGALARPLAPAMRTAGMWLAVVALALAVYATTPSIALIADAAQHGWVISHAAEPVR